MKEHPFAMAMQAMIEQGNTAALAARAFAQAAHSMRGVLLGPSAAAIAALAPIRERHRPGEHWRQRVEVYRQEMAALHRDAAEMRELRARVAAMSEEDRAELGRLFERGPLQAVDVNAPESVM